MKKFLLFSIVATALTFQLFAQTIPNAGFENWTSGNPDGWSTTNQAIVGVTQETTDFHGGAAAAKLVTKNNFVNIPGAMVAGTAAISGFTIYPTGGFPNTTRVKTFSWYYKYTPGTGDSCLIQAWLFKRSAPGGARDTVATLTFKSPETITGYTLGTMDFIYHTGAIGNETPDSALILICSSHVLSTSAVVNSTLLVDDLSFTGNVATGVKKVSAEASSVSLYPNPATDEITFKFNGTGATRLNVFDLLGKKVKSFNLSSPDITFSVSDLNNGLYFYQFVNNQQAILTTGRFSVKK